MTLSCSQCTRTRRLRADLIGRRDQSDLVKRIGSKVREIDRYYSHVVDELESGSFLLSRRVNELEGLTMRLSTSGSDPAGHSSAMSTQLEVSKTTEKQLRDMLETAHKTAARAQEASIEDVRRAEAECLRARADAGRLRERVAELEETSRRSRERDATWASSEVKIKSLETQVKQLSADNALLLGMREREKETTPPPAVEGEIEQARNAMLTIR